MHIKEVSLHQFEWLSSKILARFRKHDRGLGNRGKKEKFSLQAEYSYWSELCSRKVNFQTSKEATVLIHMMLL